VDAKEAGYLSTNTPPQGELYLRGPSVTGGYFKRPDLNKEVSRGEVIRLRRRDVDQIRLGDRRSLRMAGSRLGISDSGTLMERFRSSSE
jgi:acyl-CoA synthetase (AMP-forming)/AMP-acid ligase II